MTWENYGHGNGKWNLEHKLPCELFLLAEPKHQQICFNYKNFQPMYYENNIRKSDTLPDGRRARDLNPQEKIDYLKSLGYNLD